jgi:hypothetical protein
MKRILNPVMAKVLMRLHDPLEVILLCVATCEHEAQDLHPLHAR